MNLLHKLIEQTQVRPDHVGLFYFKGKQRHSLTWEQIGDRVQQLASSLHKRGIGPEDRVIIYSDTCKDWGFADMAIMANGAVSVPIYHSSPLEDVEFIVKESQPKLIFVQNEKLYKKLQGLGLGLPLVIFDKFVGEVSQDFLQDLFSQGSSQFSLQQQVRKIQESDLATIVYTSGTSGVPKGVCLTHQQIMSSVSEVFSHLGVTHQDRTLSFLPFSHILGRVELWGHFYCGYQLGFAQSIERIKQNLPEIQPTVIVGVPRIFEKIYFGIKAQVKISKLKQAIFNEAMAIGQESQRLKEAKQSPSFVFSLKDRLSDRLVFSTVQKKLGGRLRFAVSGGAPLDPQIAHFFGACKIPILEGYGLTETTGPIFVNTLKENTTGSVGKTFGDVEAKLDTDGEILVRSHKIFKAYINRPDDTSRAFTEDGFFRTGDIGRFDNEGYLKITDRKKDLIKTAGGKYVAPQKIQNLFATQELISHVHVHGDKQKFIVALITLDRDQVLKIKNEAGITSSDYVEIIGSPPVRRATQMAVASVNAQLASFETIKRFHILDHNFSIEGGHLTPSLKMKRKKIDQLYATEIINLYS